MSKGSFAGMNCPIAQTLEQVGEWWTFVILRNAFCGMSRFQDFQRHLGISTNILSRRLGKLVENGILLRQPCNEDARIVHYRLTPKGHSLYPILAAMTVWGEQWVPHPAGPRMTLVERETDCPWPASASAPPMGATWRRRKSIRWPAPAPMTRRTL